MTDDLVRRPSTSTTEEEKLRGGTALTLMDVLALEAT